MGQLIKPAGKTAQLLNALRDKKNISAFGLPFYSRAIILANLDSFLYVCPDYVKAAEAFEQLKSIRGQDVVYIPPQDDVLSVYKHSSSTILTRLTSLCAIAEGRAKIAVTSMLGYMQLYPKLADIRAATAVIQKDKPYAIGQLIKKLVSAGYTRVEHIEENGQFALRGDILDVAPVNLKTGVRIDFFDDIPERIRLIDLDTQAAGEEALSVLIAPCTEIFVNSNNDGFAANQGLTHTVNSSTVNSILNQPKNDADAVNSILNQPKNDADTVKSVFNQPKNDADTVKSVFNQPKNDADAVKSVFNQTTSLSHKTVSAANSAKNQAASLQSVIFTDIEKSENPHSASSVYLTDKIIGILQKSINKKLEPQYLARQTALIEELTLKLQGGTNSGLDCLKPLTDFARLPDFFDTVVFDEQKQCVDNMNAHLSEHNSRLTALLSRGEAFPFMEHQLAIKADAPKTMAAFDKLLSQNRIFQPKEVFSFSAPDLNGYAKNTAGLISDIKMWLGRGMQVNVYCEGRLLDGIKQLFTENFIPADIIKQGTLYRGGCFFEENHVLLGRGDLTFKRPSAPVKNKKAAFFQPKPGDYVVHNVHGIGVCEGLKRVDTGASARDFIVVRYEGGDKLYVAAESINLLSAYAGEEGPKLNKIGGAEFSRIKEKVKSAIKAMAFDLRELYGKRESAKGHKYNPDNAALSEFEAEFPYEETPDQLTAISEGLNDLISGKIMDRLLCGDVGYGKTEVAMRLAYKVVLEGKQVAVVSPTTILARQHYATLSKRLEKFGVSVKPLTRFEPPKSAAKTLTDLLNGKIDILCGTHRALSKDVAFKDLGLLVLDEEQRFGVADKEKIKLLKNDVNVLSLSATPIPRTLHMAMSGIRDISLLTTPPPSRIPVSTYVAEYTDSLVFDAVNRETGRGGQVFIVYNRVEKIDRFAAGISAMFPDLKIAVAHGQMDKTRLELTIGDFADGKIDILITSTIIENGIDMANVNTMIVVDADHLGLSQLYQLRGRIGRGDRLAYAFFTYDGQKTLTENAYKRLEAIAGYTEFGSGFKLAMRDLEIRGAGNILGREQHGHMQKVGYEMYLKLIGEVMDEMQGKSTRETPDVAVITDFSAFIPEDYVADIDWRLKIYKRIAGIETEEEAADELLKLKDAYGKPPQPVKNLLTVAIIKNSAAKINAEKVTVTRKKCEIKFDKALLDLKFVKVAVENGFNYSAADGSVLLKPDATTLKRLIKFLIGIANI